MGLVPPLALELGEDECGGGEGARSSEAEREHGGGDDGPDDGIVQRDEALGQRQDLEAEVTM